jgi:DNA-binding NarL/FixJ family response regulator
MSQNSPRRPEAKTRESERIKIVIIHEHPVIREGLRLFVEKQPHLSVIGVAATCIEAAKLIKTACPDIAIFDADLAVVDNMDRLASLLKVCPDTRILVLTKAIEPSLCRMAIERGVAGLFMKEHDPKALVKAIEKIAAGELWLDRSLMSTVLSSLRRHSSKPDDRQRISTITAREREVIALVCLGLRNQEIADRLFIGEKTVRNHLASIYSKLNISHRLELSIYAQKHGLKSAVGTAAAGNLEDIQ